MTDCRTCIHRHIPIAFDREHPCLGCHGERVTIGGSNYEADNETQTIPEAQVDTVLPSVDDARERSQS
jgi:hypothetical protein